MMNLKIHKMLFVVSLMLGFVHVGCSDALQNSLPQKPDAISFASKVKTSLAESELDRTDVIAPTLPTSVGFAKAASNTVSLEMSWAKSSDLQFKTHNTKLCEAPSCTAPCIDLGTSLTSPAIKTGFEGRAYYGCVQGEDLLGNKSPWAASIAPIVIDTAPPFIKEMNASVADGFYKAGSTIIIEVVFSERVVLSNSSALSLALETGVIDRVATYVSGSGSKSLRFQYQVEPGDSATDLDVNSNSPLLLESPATLSDIAGNAALLSLPAVERRIAAKAALVVDTAAPTAPSSIILPGSYSLTPSFTLNWTAGSDTHFAGSNLKLCSSQDCSTGCTNVSPLQTPPAQVLGVAGNSYFACVQSEDKAGNTSAFISSSSSLAIETLPVFAGVASGEVIGSWADGKAKIELTFSGVPDPVIQTYEVFFSESPLYTSFNLASPIATIARGDGTLDPIATDTKILLSVPAAFIKDGYYYVRYLDPLNKFIDPNRSISSLVTVLKNKPGYVLVPKLFSGLAYDFYIMRYEASLSTAGTAPGGDNVTTVKADKAACEYKFHMNGTSADSTCGTRAITKAAESKSAASPAASIDYSGAYFACRNASSIDAKVRLPTTEEWRRASQWIGTSYVAMWNNYQLGGAGNCNVASPSSTLTGSSPNCISSRGAEDMAGNMREWVDNRIIRFTPTARFGYAPVTSKTLANGIDNIVQRIHTLDPGANGMALAMGADYTTPYLADQKQYGPDVQTWLDPHTTSANLGFRCIGFRSDALPTVSQIALPDEPKFVSADLLTDGRIPENFFPEDNRWENIKITVNGNTADAVAEGKVDIAWQPWSRTTCNNTGVCASSDSGLVYKIYRFLEPNRVSIRTATPWVLGSGGSSYASDKPLDPLAVDVAGNRLFTSGTTDGTLIATISNCDSGAAGNCSMSDLSIAAGGTLNVGRIYNYALVVEDAAGNALTPSSQRYRSPYFAGPSLAGTTSFRFEPRYRRAAVFLVDEFFQQGQTRPQIMAHVPMDQSGLDHDFFIQKYESSLYSGIVTSNSSTGDSAWPLQAAVGTSTWVKNAALCHDKFLQNGTFDINGCGDGISINPTTATFQSKRGTTPQSVVNQGAAWKACKLSNFADSSGKTYALGLASDAEWNKAADWGDVNQNGTISASVNPYTGGILSVAAVAGNTGADNTTIRCHTDNNPNGYQASATSGPGSTANCRSRYNVADMVGNLAEGTNGQVRNGIGLDNGIDGLWYDQAFISNPSFFQNSITTIGSTYDLLRAYPKPVTTGAVIFPYGDDYWFGMGLNRSFRGFNRWWFAVINSTDAAYGFLGQRCSL